MLHVWIKWMDDIKRILESIKNQPRTKLSSCTWHIHIGIFFPSHPVSSILIMPLFLSVSVYCCRNHSFASAVLALQDNIVRKSMLVRHRHAPTMAFVSIYRRDMREIAISVSAHTVSLVSFLVIVVTFMFSIYPHIIILTRKCESESWWRVCLCCVDEDKLEFMRTLVLVLVFMIFV